MSWEQLWLAYRKITNYEDSLFFQQIYNKNDSRIVGNAVDELVKAAKGFFGFTPFIKNEDNVGKGIILQLSEDSSLGTEGFHIKHRGQSVIIEANNETGVLYGVFAFIRHVALRKPIVGMDVLETPDNPYRMINHWDDISGNIERGYSGNSFFFKDGEIIINERTKDYARLMSSIGINCAVINNVNVKGAAAQLITEKHFSRLKELSEILEGYGIKLFISLNFASPFLYGGLDTANPLDAGVISWWERHINEFYNNVPNFGGFIVKADSEGEPGPMMYGCTHAQGANMFAKIVEPHNGIIVWRCFVYNCMQDWRDRKTDRAKAAYEHFMPLDGQFADNVILQIKTGPMDFQIREPVSPLFGGLKKTHQMLEVQIAQEYTGQQKDVCYLVPSWKEVLDFRTYISEENDTVADIVTGKTFNDVRCGMAAVSNTGDEPNWTSHDLAAANLYGFGRLSWNVRLTSEEIAFEWTVLTFSDAGEVVSNVTYILNESLSAYENYTSPLGIGWMVNPIIHYGPNIDGYEYDVWGTYHRADHKGIGVDRSSKGTGYSLQYNEPNRSNYENIDTCPTELLLFFHYVQYDYVLKNGKTLIQHIYDSHFAGADTVKLMIQKWESIKPHINSRVYDRVMKKFSIQYENSQNWRDTVNTYFYRKSMINDRHNRIIHP